MVLLSTSKGSEMDLLNDAVQLAAAGRYGQALRAFPEARRGTDWALFHAELLERTGNYNRSRAMTESVLQTTGLSATTRASCESILGLIALQDGDADRAMAHLQRASGLFEANGLAENACW